MMRVVSIVFLVKYVVLYTSRVVTGLVHMYGRSSIQCTFPTTVCRTYSVEIYT